MQDVVLQVSDFVALTNQTLEYAYPIVTVEGEVSQFKISKNKWVYFDLKDSQSTISCFMTVYQLKSAIEDGMRLRVQASPKLTPWGRFSLTVQRFELAGEGDVKRSFEILKARLEKEGLFAPERKRPLPVMPRRIGVVSSSGAAGYADFVTIVGQRWGGVELLLADVNVQGVAAPDQIVRALQHFNELSQPVDVVVVVRGGGSADDLQAFSTENVVRAIAGSRSPVLVGVGHETDVTLADLVADRRAATPSNAAEIVVPSRTEYAEYIAALQKRLPERLQARIDEHRQAIGQSLQRMSTGLQAPQHALDVLVGRLAAYDPRAVLARGYGLVRAGSGVVVHSSGLVKKGDAIVIELNKATLEATVNGINKKD